MKTSDKVWLGKNLSITVQFTNNRGNKLVKISAINLAVLNQYDVVFIDELQVFLPEHKQQKLRTGIQLLAGLDLTTGFNPGWKNSKTEKSKIPEFSQPLLTFQP